MLPDLFFYTALSVFMTHELDAVDKKEWRLLFVLRRLDDRAGFRGFVLMHIPLFAALVWLAAHPSEGVRFWYQLSLDAFMVVHAGLHWRLRHHELYAFHSPLSRGLVNGAAVLGLLHLVLLLMQD